MRGWHFSLVTHTHAHTVSIDISRKIVNRRKNRKSNSRRDILTSVSLVTRHRWFHRDISVVIANLNYSLPILMSVTDDKICQALFIFHTFESKKKKNRISSRRYEEWIDEWNDIYFDKKFYSIFLFFYYFIIKIYCFYFRDKNLFQNPIHISTNQY